MRTQKSFITKFGELLDEHRADRQHDQSQSMPTQASRLTRLLHWLTPNGGTLILILLLIFTQNIWAGPAATATNAPGPSATTINYQGRLADSGGTPINGTQGMTFALYDAPSGGNLVWGPESHPAIAVSDGLFSVGLGSQTGGGIPTSVWNGGRYLEVTVGGETLSPRELIRSVPIAGMALTVPDGAVTQAQASFAPMVYHQGNGQEMELVDKPIIYSGWFHGSDEGYASYDLSAIFSQIDAVIVTKTRLSGGNDKVVTFMATDNTGTGKPKPSEIKIWAHHPVDGTLRSWIQAYVVVIGR